MKPIKPAVLWFVLSPLMAGSVLISPMGMRAQEPVWIDPRFSEVPAIPGSRGLGRFLKLDDGSIMGFSGSAETGATIQVTKDGGKIWSAPRKMIEGLEPGPGRPTEIAAVLKTKQGTIVADYMSSDDRKWTWSDALRDAPGARLDVWTVRSTDGGKTWVDRQRVLEGWCGAPTQMIQTRDEQVVLAIELLLHDPGHFGVATFVSADEGKTWKRSNIIDLGGSGHHDGVNEPTLVQLRDGRLWMLMRTSWDKFWEAFSSDNGLSWRVIQPSRLDASSAPGYLLRLASGRLVLAWNRYQAESGEPPPLKTGALNDHPTSWFREELSASFSDDDGQTWSRPFVWARQKKGSVTYPYILEPESGVLWIGFMFNEHRLFRLREADLLK